MGMGQTKTVNKLIKEIRSGNGSAGKELVYRYKNLIYKTCGTIYARYGGLIPMDDLLVDAKNLVLYLAVMEYKTEDEVGLARFPHFIKIHLHANLVRIYRPTVTYRSRGVEINDLTPIEEVPSEFLAMKHERDEVVVKIKKFIATTMNRREQDLVINHVLGGQTQAEIARKWGVSRQRMLVVYKVVIRKLRKFLATLGIKSMRDI